MTSTYLNYKLVSRDIPKTLNDKASEKINAREIKYYSDHIAEIKSVDDFIGNARIFNFAMQAFGLDDMAYAKGFMKKILAGPPDAHGLLLVDRIQDARFRDFANAFDFRTYGADTTQRPEARKAPIDAYVRQKVESDAGLEDEGTRLALYFKRQAGTIKSAFGILADKALAEVVRTALGLPPEMAMSNLDAQAALINRKLDIASFQDPAKLDTFIKRFTILWDQKNDTASAPTLSLFGGSDSGFDTGLLLKLQSIRLGGTDMQASLYVTLSAQMALEQRLNTVATNVANLGTAGYRAEEVKFETILSQAGGREVAFTTPGEAFLSRKAGPLTKTDSPLDVGVQGDGWLAVRGPGGPVYTRDGRMQVTPAGDLQDLSGRPILDPGGSPLTVDPEGPPITIGQDGIVSQGPTQIGALGVFRLDPAAKLVRVAGGAVASDRPGRPILDFNQRDETTVRVQQGFQEGANVNPVMEMSRLIEITRTFENAAAATAETEAALQDAIRGLGPSA